MIVGAAERSRKVLRQRGPGRPCEVCEGLPGHPSPSRESRINLRRRYCGTPQIPTCSYPGVAIPSSYQGRHAWLAPGHMSGLLVSQKGVQQPGTNPAPSARTHLGLEKLRFWIFGGFFGGLKFEFSVALDSLRAVHAKAPAASRSTASAFILGESVDLRGPRTKLPKHAHGDEPVRDPYSSCPGESAPTFQGRRSVGGYGKGRVVACADA